MIYSHWRIDFQSPSGSTRLLDYGDYISDEIAPKRSQAHATYHALLALNSQTVAGGGALTALTWSVRRNHASHADLRNAVLRTSAGFPSGQTGTLRLSVQDGETWDILNTTLTATEPVPLVPCSGYQTLTSYSAVGGALTPASEITIYPGIPWGFLRQNWEDLAQNWEDL